MSTRVEAAPGGKSLERWLSGLFIVAAVIDLGANLIPGLSLGLWLNRLSKPVLVPALAGLFALRARGHVLSIRPWALYVALLFCWVGDVALLIDGAFVYGMGGFALAHIFFIVAYSRDLPLSVLGRSSTGLFAMPILTYGYMIYLTLYLNLPADQHSLALPLAGYMLVLLSNGLTCLLRVRQDKWASSPSILLGVVLFIQSDSLIAMTRYVAPLPLGDFAIMLTYILGLYWMVQGALIDVVGPPHPPVTDPVHRSSVKT